MRRVVRGLILDLFGVLVSGNPRIFYEELILKSSLVLDNRVWSNLYAKASSGGIDYKTFVEDIAVQISLLPDEIEGRLEDVISKNVSIINSGDAFLSHLEETGVPFVILTNSISEWVEITLEKLNILGLASPIVISSSIRVRKPRPRAYMLAAEALGRTAQDLVYLGDEDEDVRGAKDVGMYSVFIAGEDEVSLWCDYQISNLSEIMDLSFVRFEP